MRPPILEWKVFLALLGVVLVAAALGSVLRSTSQTPHRGTGLYVVHVGDSPQSGGGLGSLVERLLLSLGGTQSGGWTGYQPLRGGSPPIYSPANMPPQMRREVCARLKAELTETQNSFRHGLEQSIRSICRKRR
jgi:hypothetical protein